MKTNTILLVGGGVIVALYVLKNMLPNLNPFDGDNVVAAGVDDALGLTEQGSSLGSWVYDFFHEEYDPNA